MPRELRLPVTPALGLRLPAPEPPDGARRPPVRRVFFVEEPVPTTGPCGWSASGSSTEASPWCDRTCLPIDEARADAPRVLRALVDHLVRAERIDEPVLWYYTPMALPWTDGISSRPRRRLRLHGRASRRSGARPPALRRARRPSCSTPRTSCSPAARSLYEAKRAAHPRTSTASRAASTSAHFRTARVPGCRSRPTRPAIPQPRIGYFGVIDERIDLDLIDGVAARAARAGSSCWSVRSPRSTLPTLPDARRTSTTSGRKAYDELPAYLAGWDVALMPFARNEATRYISPTKTPEYLAAGLPVVSTPIRDVVEPYGRDGLVAIADTVEGTVRRSRRRSAGRTATRATRADAFLATQIVGSDVGGHGPADRRACCVPSLRRGATARVAASGRRRTRRRAAPGDSASRRRWPCHCERACRAPAAARGRRRSPRRS